MRTFIGIMILAALGLVFCLVPAGNVPADVKSLQFDTKLKKPDPLTGWTTTFVVDKKDLVSAGKNPYYILEPGYQLVLEGGDERIEGVQTTARDCLLPGELIVRASTSR